MKKNNQLKEVYESLLKVYKKTPSKQRLALVKKFGHETTEAFEQEAAVVLGLTKIRKRRVSQKPAPAGGGVHGVPLTTTVVDTTQTVVTEYVPGPSTPITPVIPTIHNVHLLDASTSMDADDKIGVANKGINREMELLRGDKTVNYTQTFVHFSGAGDIRWESVLVPIDKAPSVNVRTRGLTAMLDAIGVTLSTLRARVTPGDKVLVKIFTDGGENSSREWSWRTVRDLIAKVEANHGFTVTFVGTEQDVRMVQERLNIDDSNTLIHNNTQDGVTRSFLASASATMSYASKVKKGESVLKGFYKKTGTLGNKQ